MTSGEFQRKLFDRCKERIIMKLAEPGKRRCFVYPYLLRILCRVAFGVRCKHMRVHSWRFSKATFLNRVRFDDAPFAIMWCFRMERIPFCKCLAKTSYFHEAFAFPQSYVAFLSFFIH